MRESAISARIDSETKKKVEEIFKKLGLSHSSAINLFYSQILLHNGLPFETKLKQTFYSSSNCEEVAEPQVSYNQSGNVKLAMEYFLNELIEKIDIKKKEKVLSREELFMKVDSVKKKYESSGFIILGFFGSYARNEAHEKSDIDLLYELSPDFRKKYKGFKAVTEIERIKNELEVFFGLKVDLVDRASMGTDESSIVLNEVVYV